MNISKKKNKLFVSMVRTPLAAIIITLLITVSLVLITYNSFVGVYVQAKGEMVYDITAQETYIQAYVSDEFYNSIGKSSRVLWFTAQQGKRYEGTIFEIQNQKEKKALLIKIRPNQDEIRKEVGVDRSQKSDSIYLDILYRKDRAISKILDYLT
ncbi:MAG: hypothetical protein N3B21_14310 [Clostridia bacterium]|nr:hypothetical protein [Clostridia bacterium]